MKLFYIESSWLGSSNRHAGFTLGESLQPTALKDGKRWELSVRLQSSSDSIFANCYYCYRRHRQFSRANLLWVAPLPSFSTSLIKSFTRTGARLSFGSIRPRRRYSNASHLPEDCSRAFPSARCPKSPPIVSSRPLLCCPRVSHSFTQITTIAGARPPKLWLGRECFYTNTSKERSRCE